MWTSPKRYIATKDGQVVEAGPGVSGTLIVAEGCQIPEDRAREFGLLPAKEDMPKQKPMVEPIIVRGPEGEVKLGAEGEMSVTEEPSTAPETSEANVEGGESTETQKPWETPAAGPALELNNE